MASHSVCLLHTRQKGQTSVNIRRSHPSMYSRTKPSPSKHPRKAHTFLCRLIVVYTRSSARNCVVTSLALLWSLSVVASR
jgi:hypothetical protein